MARKSRVTFHHVQLTADPRFRAALDKLVEDERILKGRRRYPAAFVECALNTIEGREGREIASVVGGLDLSAANRAGAVRITGAQWRRARLAAPRLSRTSDHPCPVAWSARAVILAALYCHAIGH